MSEATVDTNTAAEAAALADAARKIEYARMRQVGGFHFALVMGALTLWGAAETWAQATGLTIARFAAVANAVIAAWVISSTLHEWGHFAGARLSGAKSPVLDEPRRHFFMFDFPIAENDLRQFLWMSWGGILAPWALVVLALMLAPLDTASGVVLVAAFLTRAVAVSVFEGPVTRRAERSGDPGGELGKALAAGALDRGRHIGAVVGVAAAALLWLAA